MIKRKFNKYLLLSGILIVILAAVAPSIAAYEGHLIDIKAHETIPATKEARLATPLEITTANANGACINFDTNTVTTWNYIPKETCVAWIVNMLVTNPNNYTMYNVTIYDEFNENVEIATMSVSQGTVNIPLPNKNRVDLWNVGNIPANGTACLTLIVWTKCYEVCVSSSSPSLNLSCSLFSVFYGLFTKGSDCPPVTCYWVCKTLKQSSDDKYYLQLYSTWNTTGILMKWDYYNENAQLVHDSYNGGPLLEITVHN